MTNNSPRPKEKRLCLKETSGWFPAGQAFQQALILLSDGAFKMFVYLCLNADRQTASYTATHHRLAAVLKKSRRAIGTYVVELQEKGICSVQAGKNNYVCTVFQVREAYWPYRISEASQCNNPAQDPNRYVDSIRDSFLKLGCTVGRFSPADERGARELEKRGVALTVVHDAILLGACRKYISWLNNGPSDPIATLRYFEPLIEEVQERPFPDGYRDHLRFEVKKLADLWTQQQTKIIQTESIGRSKIMIPFPAD